MRNGAVGAVPRADVTKDHERGGAVFPAFADIGAVGLLADGMQVELLHHLLEAYVIRASRGLHLEPRRLTLGERLAPVASHDLNQLLGHILLGKARTGPGRDLQKVVRETVSGNSLVTFYSEIDGIPGRGNFTRRLTYG